MTALLPIGVPLGSDWGIDVRKDRIAIRQRIENMPNELARKIFRSLEDKHGGGPTDETTLTNLQLAAQSVAIALVNDDFETLEFLISPEFSRNLVAESNDGLRETAFPPGA